MIKISKGLRSITRNEDCLARVGGDEFVIILADWMNLEYGDDSKFREDFSKKLLKLGKELADDFRDSGHSTYRHLTVLDYGFAYLSKKHDFKDAYARADRNSKRMKEINDLSLVKI
jgi:GGDEF domain-containing protein